MAVIKKLAAGRWQLSFQSHKAGIPRSRRTYRTKALAGEALRALESEVAGGPRVSVDPRTFGQALDRYLREDSPLKRSHADDVSNARALAIPAWNPTAGSWCSLRDAPLTPRHGQQGVPEVLEIWARDQSRIMRRSRIGGQRYELRPGPHGTPTWYLQPPAGGGVRRVVAGLDTLQALGASSSLGGPVSSGTIRTRQILAVTVLRKAWRAWGWIETDEAARVIYRRPAPAREAVITSDQVVALLCAAPVDFGHLILGAAWSGLRRENLVALTWHRVRLSAPEQRGHISIPADGGTRGERSKNGELLWLPLSTRLDQLLRERLSAPGSGLVFSRADGGPWADFRKLWATTKARAGVPADMRWHDLRATWATGYAQLTTKQLQALGGWKDSASAERYIRIGRGHLADLVDLHDTVKTL